MIFKKTTLKNGLRVITVPMVDNPSVTVLVMVQAGSKYEEKAESGLSHFLEHMFFKGTNSRPKASDISRELDSIGAHYNAFTMQEFTGYYAKAAARHTDKILDVISDMFSNPLFDPKEMEKEKGVIIEEIRMYSDLPQRRVSELFYELLYGDQPAGWFIAGDEATVKSFTREALVEYRAKHYTSQATTVIVSGSFDETKILADIERAFASIPTEKAKPKVAVKEAQSAPKIATIFKETDQTHLVIGVRTFPVLDPRTPILRVLAGVLGAGMSSRLFAKMRDDLGICYYISADNEPYTDHGVFSISAGVDNARVEEGIKGILEECRRVRDELVPEAELQKVKEHVAGSLLLGLETSDARAEFCGYQEAVKQKIQSVEEIIAETRAVTAAQVQELARVIFVDKGLNMAMIGRFKDSKPFESYFKI